ncbi:MULTISPECIES: alpha/beta fold hydrolase [Henriciella]|jgi:pimeloyl-ACP methyl ester carboxylesterase|nr:MULTISPECIES: alpha/beta hydrolase [Henriciella]MCH2457961.1 alpha/beta hydrolase [Henriciella sp.]MCZ4298211.1 alpha/beta hydrolase [Henriciella marina]
MAMNDGCEREIQASGLTLTCSAYGQNSAPTVIFAHGGGQTRHAWKGAARSLGQQGFYSIALDLRGHGDSEWAEDGDYSLEAFGRDLVAVAEQLSDEGRAPHIVGASLGGLGAMVGAGMLQPKAFASITLVDITPNMEASGVAKIIGFMAEHSVDGFATLEEAADVIAQYLPHRPRPTDLDGLRKNLRQGQDKRWRWHWDPAFIQGVMKRSAVERAGDLEQSVRNITVPVHLVRGRMSELVSEASVQKFQALLPQAHFTDVAGARHMVAGDNNDVFTTAVSNFLRQHSEVVEA